LDEFFEENEFGKLIRLKGRWKSRVRKG